MDVCETYKATNVKFYYMFSTRTVSGSRFVNEKAEYK